MTTMDAAAARRRQPRVALPILFALTGLGLAGCESSSSLFSGFSLPGSSTPRRRSPRRRHSRRRRWPRSRSRRSSVRPMPSASSSIRSSRATRAPARHASSPAGREGGVHPARLRRRGEGEERHEGLLHLGRHRSLRQAREPHHRRGGCGRDRQQGPMGGAHPAGGTVDRRQGRNSSSPGCRARADSPLSPLRSPRASAPRRQRPQ